MYLWWEIHFAKKTKQKKQPLKNNPPKTTCMSEKPISISENNLPPSPPKKWAVLGFMSGLSFNNNTIIELQDN